MALESIAVRYFLTRGRSWPPWSGASAAKAIYFGFTLEVMESIAVRYFLMRGRSWPPRRRWSGASAAEAIYFGFTLEVMDAITIDAILN